MDMLDVPTLPKAGPITRLLLKIASVDEETLRRCPPADWKTVRAVAEINLLTFIYMASLFSLIGHRLYASPGQVRPELILIGGFLAAFLVAVDSFMVNRAGYVQSGIAELARGGLDISGGMTARLKLGGMLVVRILLSVCIAQLSGIFVSLCIFSGDINAHAQHLYNEANAGLIASMAATVDGRIKQLSDAVATESARYTALSVQVENLRQNEIDPTAGNPAARQAQQEIDQLLATKSRAEDELRQKEQFETDELGGLRNAAGNSGRAGNGPRHRAAVSAAANARRHVQETEAALSAARGRLDQLRSQLAAAGDQTRQQSARETPVFEKALAVEQDKLTGMQEQLDKLARDRDATIHAMVENAPGHVSLNVGLLAQIRALEEIARDDTKIATLIILIDITSFGFELAAVLVKITCYVPTTYAALLVRDVYMRSVQIANEMMAELEAAQGDRRGYDDAAAATSPADVPAATVSPAEQVLGFPVTPFDGSNTAAPEQPKRPRGRPRKTQVH